MLQFLSTSYSSPLQFLGENEHFFPLFVMVDSWIKLLIRSTLDDLMAFWSSGFEIVVKFFFKAPIILRRASFFSFETIGR